VKEKIGWDGNRLPSRIQLTDTRVGGVGMECGTEEKTNGIYTEKKRKKLISKEYKRLEQSITDLDDKRKATLLKLFSDAAFIAITLEEARLIIQRDGITEEYQNGANQSGVKKSAAVEVYDKMVNTYVKVIDQINKALPAGKQLDGAGSIKDFMK
jgi:hypothetical protein